MPTSLPQKDQKIVEVLKELGLFEVGYPLEQLAIRRAIFRSQARRLNKRAQKLEEQRVIGYLESLGTVKAEYDPELLTARRAIFSNQLRQLKDRAEQAKDQEIIRLLGGLRVNKAEYPANMLAARQSAFLNYVVKKKRATWLEAFRFTVQNVWSSYKEKFPPPMWQTLYTTLILAVLVFAALKYGLPTPLRGVSQAFAFPTNNALATSDQTCGSPSSCLTALNNLSLNLSSQRNGFARAAVAKDAINRNHQASLANDGLYGNRSSWVSQSAYSWLKIDLGKATLINTVAISQDHSGDVNNQIPGEFIISTALSDNVYANGDSSNDNVEFIQIYDSKSARYIGDMARSGTVIAYFEPVNARYIKITFAKPGTTIDEVAIFMSNSVAFLATEQNKEKGIKSQPNGSGLPTNTLIPTSTFTSIPSNTPLPTSTWTLVPTNTLPPTQTSTPIPTDTLIPTNTPTLIPTDTLEPTDTPTEIPLPTETPQPADTDTPVPTDTSVPIPTDTLEPLSLATP